MSDVKSFMADGRGMGMLIYTLLFFMPMTLGATGVLALILTTFADSDKTPEWVRSHYRFQVRTFWISIVPTLATFFLMTFLRPLFDNGLNFMLVMFVVVIPVLGWIASRCAMGFNHLLYGRPYPNPATWLV